jgi:hypothetical protein
MKRETMADAVKRFRERERSHKESKGIIAPVTQTIPKYSEIYEGPDWDSMDHNLEVDPWN